MVTAMARRRNPRLARGNRMLPRLARRRRTPLPPARRRRTPLRPAHPPSLAPTPDTRPRTPLLPALPRSRAAQASTARPHPAGTDSLVGRPSSPVRRRRSLVGRALGSLAPTPTRPLPRLSSPEVRLSSLVRRVDTRRRRARPMGRAGGK